MAARVVMYTRKVCPYCVMAEKLLQSRGVQQIEKIFIDGDERLRDQMMAKTGRRTVPQIYIGGRHVGGYDDLAALDKQGCLAPMLEEN
ncbi:MAG: glutaredoxin 3 [Oxalobacter formigenes]|nr:glutaredoxin 3 [Oxalobacter formigenes]